MNRFSFGKLRKDLTGAGAPQTAIGLDNHRDEGEALLVAEAGRVQMVEDMIDRGIVKTEDLIDKYNIEETE